MKNTKAFTMLEILIITIVISIGLVSILLAVNHAKTLTNQTKQSVIATQLAKEGIEMLYQIRNTNLLKYPNYKNYCRLSQNSKNECSDSTNSERIQTGNYILTNNHYLTGTNENLDTSDGINTGEKIFNLCLTSGQRISCPLVDNQTRYGKFFRTIKGKGLYIKDTDTTGGIKIICAHGNAGGTTPSPESIAYTCGSNGDNTLHPMEFHFCSRVEYIGTKTGSVEICGILTNFFD